MTYKWFVLMIAAIALSTLAYSQHTVVLSSGNNTFSREVLRVSQAGDRPEEVVVDGIYLKAFAAAFEEFKNDNSIPAEKRILEDYKIFFSRDKECINVSFFSKKHEKALEISGAMIGEMEYCVSGKSFAVLRRMQPK